MPDYHALFDELLSIEWSSRFESFDARERRILTGFNDFGWQLGNRSFFHTPIRFHMGSAVTLTHAGTEALELAATTLRKSWLPKEIANHERAIKILRGRICADEDGAQTARVLDTLEANFCAARAEELMTLVDPEDLKLIGTPNARLPRTIQAISAEMVLDDWLHGIVVHGDPRKADAVARWSPSAYEWSAVKAVCSITEAVFATHIVTRGAMGVLLEDRR